MSQTLVTTIWTNPNGLYAIEFWSNNDGTYDIRKTHLFKDTLEIIGENLHKLEAHIIYKQYAESGTVERSI